MKWFANILIGFALVAVAAGQTAPATGERIVRIQLTNDTVVEGVVVSEDDHQVVIMEERAGGTIRQTRTIPRKDMAALTEFNEAERRDRAHQLALAELQRYQLRSDSSYEAEHYTQVIDRVFRPFLERFPESPYAADVRTRIDAWTMELDRVRTGRVKYLGTWMDADAARRLQAEANAELLLRQAQSLITRRQYARALAKLEPLDSAAAAQLEAQAYRRWVPQLENQQQQAAQQVATAQDRVTRAQEALPAAPGSQPKGSILGEAKEVAQGESYEWLGQQGRDVVAYNKAKQELAAAQQALGRAQAQLTAAERELTRVRSLASAAGVAATSPGASGSVPTGADGQPLYVSVSPDKEDWSNPSLLQNMWRFAQRYWMIGAVVLVLGLWFVTRKLAK